MGEFNGTYVTAAGKRLLAKTQTGVQLVISRAVTGDGYLPENADIVALTELISPVNDAKTSIINNKVTGDGLTELKVRIESGSTGFRLREIGIMAVDPDEGEILYAYTNAGDYADWLAATVNTPNSQDYTLITEIDNAKDIKVNIDVTAGVSQLEFDERLSEKLEKKVISELPSKSVLYDFEDGVSVFTAQSNMIVDVTDGVQNITTITNNSTAKRAYFDFSDITSGAKSVIIEYDARIDTDSRWGISLVDIANRPTAYSSAGIDTTASAFWHGTRDGKIYYINEEYSSTWGAFFGNMVHVVLEIDIVNRTLNYTITSSDGKVTATRTNKSFVGDAEEVTGIEFYSWLGDRTACIDNISIKAVYGNSDNAIYLISNSLGRYNAYVYVDGEPVMIGDSVIASTNQHGVVKISSSGGISVSNGEISIKTRASYGLATNASGIYIKAASTSEVNAKTNTFNPIVPAQIDNAVRASVHGQYNTSPVQIGTWIDGTPIWRMAYDFDFTEAQIEEYNMLGTVSAPKPVTAVESFMILSESGFISYGTAHSGTDTMKKCLLDSPGCSWKIPEGVTLSMNTYCGFRGYIEFIAKESDIVTGTAVSEVEETVNEEV